MNGSPTDQACKHEKGMTATEICTFRGNEGFALLARTISGRPANEDRLRGIR